MSPGLAVDKRVLSPRDLLTHSASPRVHQSSDVVRALLEAESIASAIVNGESALELLCFGSSEVKPRKVFSSHLKKINRSIILQISTLLRAGVDLHTSSVSTLTRQSLCQLLDPEDPLGKDWCLLAVQLGLTDKVSMSDKVFKSASFMPLCSGAQAGGGGSQGAAEPDGKAAGRMGDGAGRQKHYR